MPELLNCRAGGILLLLSRPLCRCSRRDAGDWTCTSRQERACPKSASDQPRPVSCRADRQLYHYRAAKQHIPERLIWTGRFWPEAEKAVQLIFRQKLRLLLTENFNDFRWLRLTFRSADVATTRTVDPYRKSEPQANVPKGSGTMATFRR